MNVWIRQDTPWSTVVKQSLAGSITVEWLSSMSFALFSPVMPLSYTGKFSKGVIAGFGEMKYEAVGHHYRGAWKDNRKHGVGTFR